MKRSILLLLSALCVLLSASIVCYAAPPREDYTLVLADEFDGNALNTEIWGYRGGGTNRNENVRIEDGIMHIDYKYSVTEDAEGTKKYDFTGGGVITNETLRYGYYEVRAKAYSGVRGLHTSFWNSGYGYGSLSPKPDYKPENNTFMEIDVFEIDSRADGEYPGIPQCLHYFVGEHSRGEIINNEKEIDFDCSQEWFVMGMEWLPDRVNYYLNDKLCGTVENVQEYGQAYMWLTALAQPEKLLNEDGTYDVDFDKADENGLFGSSQFDYFRYYQLPIQDTNLLGNGNFENNRPTESRYPSGFELKGDTAAAGLQKSPRAFDGICYHIHQSSVPYSLSTGQEFAHLMPGKYTFKGQFKSSGILSKAKIVVYDKDGEVLAEKRIIGRDKWTENELTDIEITDYAYVAIESASQGGTLFSMDCLEFFLQEGVELPESEGVRKYEQCTGVDPIDGPHYTLKDAIRYDEDIWKTSGLLEDAFYMTLTNKMEEPIEVYWEIPVNLAGEYRLEWRNLPSGGNTQEQEYYIVTPDGTETKITLDTSENGVDDWVSLGRYKLNAGDVLKVTMRSVAGKTGHYRCSRFRLNNEEVFSVYESVNLTTDNAVFSYKNGPYMFEKDNEQLVPYLKDGVYYIPYKELHSAIGITANIPEDSIYVTAEQLKEAGYGVTVSDSLIMIHHPDALINENVLQQALKNLHAFALPQNKQYAVFTNNEDVDGQIKKECEEVEYIGGLWNKSSTPVKNRYLNGLAEGESWTDPIAKISLQAPKAGKYAIEFYSPSYSTASSNVTITVYAKGAVNEYQLNQKTTEVGWYKVGLVDLAANDVVNMEITTAERFLRIGGARLVPLYDAPKVTKSNEKLSVDLGHAVHYVGKIILAENTENGVAYQLITPTQALTDISLQDKDNAYRLFFWQSMTDFKPIYLPE